MQELLLTLSLELADVGKSWVEQNSASTRDFHWRAIHKSGLLFCMLQELLTSHFYHARGHIKVLIKKPAKMKVHTQCQSLSTNPIDWCKIATALARSAIEWLVNIHIETDNTADSERIADCKNHYSLQERVYSKHQYTIMFLPKHSNNVIISKK